MRAVDLFCGVGGLSAGLSRVGMEVAAAYDNWPAAVATYRRNLGDHATELDLLDVDAAIREIRAYSPDLVAGGPPCQDFSTAGKRIEGDKANLTVAFGRIIASIVPQFILMENVPQARSSAAYQSTREMLESIGYQFCERTLNASYCSVPQIRKRFFAFGWRDESVRTGERFAEWIDNRQAVTPMTVKDYLGDDIDIDFYYRHPRNYSRRSVFTVHEPSPTIRGVNRPVPPDYKGNHLDSAPPALVRPLTSWERSRIQTFPPDWKWGASNDRNADVELLIGNAVPVNLAAFVGMGVVHAAS